MALNPFPSVPSFPGVPPLAGAFVGAVITLLGADDPAIAGLVGDPQWGVFDDGGNAVVTPDSVISFEHSKGYRLSNYPVEEGAFASYNKVEEPYEERITFAKGGSIADRSGFIGDLEALEASLDLYTVITPEQTYINANVSHVSYARHARNGATLIVAELSIEEVRIAGSSSFGNTASPAGANSVSGGTVQPQAPSATQSAAASAGAT